MSIRLLWRKQYPVKSMIRQAMLVIVGTLTFGTFAVDVMAAPQVNLDIVALKQVKDENGRAVLKPAQEFDVGEIITYRIQFANTGDEAATGVVIENPIPKDTVYVSGSAKGANAKVEFSSDGGKRYQAVAAAEGKSANTALTHVRWIVAKIEAGASGSVQYQVTVR